MSLCLSVKTRKGYRDTDKRSAFGRSLNQVIHSAFFVLFFENIPQVCFLSSQDSQGIQNKYTASLCL